MKVLTLGTGYHPGLALPRRRNPCAIVDLSKDMGSSPVSANSKTFVGALVFALVSSHMFALFVIHALSVLSLTNECPILSPTYHRLSDNPRHRRKARNKTTPRFPVNS